MQAQIFFVLFLLFKTKINMKIIETHHFKERVDLRINNWLDYAKNTFKNIAKKMKKKWHWLSIRPWKFLNTYTVLYKWLIYVFKKELWEYTLITVYENDKSSYNSLMDKIIS